jgi:hypothetical protein
MLHSLQPGEFVAGPDLHVSSQCPECERSFIFAKGAIALSHYHEMETGQLRRGLMCFCSTRCLLRWEHPRMLGLMQ